MKSKSLSALLSALLFIGTSCGEDKFNKPEFVNPDGGTGTVETPKPGKIYSWEQERKGIIDYTDMVLFYGGGRQRYIANWDEDRISSYVTYTDEKGNETWFFDAFLFLEFADYGTGSSMVTYATGYTDPSTGKILNSATKADWQRLADYYFTHNHNLDELDKTVGKAAGRLGAPKTKRRVVITIPEPIKTRNTSVAGSPSTYWGKLDDATLDFSKSEDRVKACCWYIDYIRALFNDRAYRNIELAGFYWISEKATESQDILAPVSEYLHGLNYSFNWIPFFTAAGYDQWKKWGFDYAFYQPNYFFKADNESSDTLSGRLDEACEQGLKAGMGMEMEFDDNALASFGTNCRAYKLRNYMKAFRRHKVWDNCRLAYYQGNNTVHSLKTSTREEDKALYHEFGNFVTSRPYRSK